MNLLINLQINLVKNIEIKMQLKTQETVHLINSINQNQINLLKKMIQVSFHLQNQKKVSSKKLLLIKIYQKILIEVHNYLNLKKTLIKKQIIEFMVYLRNSKILTNHHQETLMMVLINIHFQQVKYKKKSLNYQELVMTVLI